MSHICPRPECDRAVPDDRFACRGDWYALPTVLRYAIGDGYRSGDLAAHAAAMADAREWYVHHPPRRTSQTPRTTRTGGETGDQE